MSKYRRKAKVDLNQQQIVADLRKLGMTVKPGHDDILVGYRGLTFWFEIKSGEVLSKKTGKVLQSKKKESQIKLEETWKGHYEIVSSLEQILESIDRETH